MATIFGRAHTMLGTTATNVLTAGGTQTILIRRLEVTCLVATSFNLYIGPFTSLDQDAVWRNISLAVGDKRTLAFAVMAPNDQVYGNSGVANAITVQVDYLDVT